MTDEDECVVRVLYEPARAVVRRTPPGTWATQVLKGRGLGPGPFADRASLAEALAAIAHWGNDRVTLVQ
ncbi:hypothetical protein [Cryobacterium sp. N21]|uniref:hypothetical protein n=1 Tax=Cryobacterium sp. N21 TaxID=2048289 RepID=UPI001124FAF0|nr:hypothetical protein [Cryobacterium sp. N21]